MEPQHPRQRQYEALRAYFVKGLPSAVAARRFGYTPGSFRVLCHSFRQGPRREFFQAIARGPQVQTKKDPARPLIVGLRKHLVFDSQLATYANAGEAARPRGDLHHHAPAVARAAAGDGPAPPVGLADGAPGRAPSALPETPKVIDQRIRLREYPDPLRQLFITDLGHEQPTVLLTNDLRSTPAALIIRYARRMLIENGLADAVNFLHLDALSSAVALNVSFDVLLTTMATGLYRLVARKLRGFERAQPRQIWRRFLKSPAQVRVTEDEVVVELPRRAHNPILIASGLLADRTPVPWWNG